MPSARCKYCNKVIKKTLGRGRPREFCDEKCSRRYRRMSPCEECGNPSWSKLCIHCSNAHLLFSKWQGQAILWNQILDLRTEGLLNYEIAAVLHKSHTMISTSITRMRKAGLKVPDSTYDPHTYMDKWFRLRVARGDIKVHGDINL